MALAAGETTINGFCINAQSQLVTFTDVTKVTIWSAWPRDDDGRVFVVAV